MSFTLARILLVDDEPENLRALERTLKGKFEVVAVGSAEEAFKALEGPAGASTAVVVSDQRMPGMTGTELLSRIARVRPLVTRVILTAHTETREMLDAINRAAIYRYVTKPWDNDELVAVLKQAAEHHHILRQNQELLAELAEKNETLMRKEHELVAMNQQLEKLVEQRTAELKRANERLSELAMTDPLTRVLNRRALFQRFGDEIERAKRYGRPGAVAMLDVDHFKAFNDMEGHVLGDEALKRIAQLLQSNLRRTDVLGRYGGEEFLVIMPETKVTNALEICERLRASVERTAFQGAKEAAYLTLSIGIAPYPVDKSTVEETVEVADRALYLAKQHGRNRVVAGDGNRP